MTAHNFTRMHAHVLLLLSLEPQSVTEVATRLVKHHHVIELSSVRFLLNSLVALGLVVMDRGQKGMKLHYRLAYGVAVEAALEQAYEMVAER